MVLIRLLASLLVVFIAPLASAHGFSYVGGIDHVPGTGQTTVISCDVPPQGFSRVGIVCFEPGHVEPDATGNGGVNLDDTIMTNVSGLYCQDVNADGLCGDNGDNREHFCGTAALSVGLNWDLSLTIYVFVDGPVSGGPAVGACGLAPTWGAMGTAWHT